ncbi:MAG: HD domain-containing protein [Defluviitaleaceae bacterium]|nr:HD domain-containing protein [Defluviitaleaceae bacterium]
MNNLIQQAKMFLHKTLNSCTKIDDIEKKYRYEHSMRVAAIANQIAEAEGLNVLIVVVAAILHDVGKFETDVNADHGRVSADVALPFLKSTNLTDEQVRHIHYAIAVHVDGKAGYEYENTAEAETVSDSDNIDRFGVYRIYQSMQWDKADETPALELMAKYEDRIAKTKKFAETFKLYTPTANKLFQHNLNIQIKFYENLTKELKLTGF